MGEKNAQLNPTADASIELRQHFPIVSTSVAAAMIVIALIVALPVLAASPPNTASQNTIVVEMGNVQVVGSEDHIGYLNTAISLSLDARSETLILSLHFKPKENGELSVRAVGDATREQIQCTTDGMIPAGGSNNSSSIPATADQSVDLRCAVRGSEPYAATLGKRSLNIPKVVIVSNTEPGCLIMMVPEEFHRLSALERAYSDDKTQPCRHARGQRDKEITTWTFEGFSDFVEVEAENAEITARTWWSGILFGVGTAALGPVVTFVDHIFLKQRRAVRHRRRHAELG